MPKKQRKNFVVDTSVLLYHEDSIHAFHDNNLWIPLVVLEELDKFKTRNDSVGNAARYVNRFLDKLREKGSLDSGVSLENGQEIRVIIDCEQDSSHTMLDIKNDNKIIFCALKLKETKKNVILVTRDISMRIKADSLGIKAENYSKEKAKINRKGAFTGVSVIDVCGEDIDCFYEKGFVYVDESLYYNECVVLKSNDKRSALGIYDGSRVVKLPCYTDKKHSISGISAKNKEQVFAMNMLMDKKIPMVTITGKAGSGKTIMACATSLAQLFSGEYDKIIISRPISSTSGEIGFLPGDKNEKMKSWIQPFLDNFKIILKERGNSSKIEMLIESGQLEIESLSFIRGRSLPNTIFILDEAQNINYWEAKAVLTRMGEGSKLILLGDLDQIDAPHLDSSTSGLAAIVELFKEYNLSSHITLLKGERSALATLAAEIL